VRQVAAWQSTGDTLHDCGTLARKHWLDGHVVLARRLPHPRFRGIETFSPRNHVHYFRLTSTDDIDDDFRAWLREAYAVGCQEHLRPRRP
jgi:hypothetical protein